MTSQTKIVDRIFGLTWIESASCVKYDPELWFPKQGNPGNDAKNICYGCPVFLECRIYGLSVRLEQGPRSLFGVWGGLNRVDRKNGIVAQTLLDEALDDLTNR